MEIMQENKVLHYIKDVLENMPASWLNLTTHRLDIYEEKLAKIQFLDQFEDLFNNNNSEQSALNELPTSYDYIRLGHPLSCVLEWAIAKVQHLQPESVISFSSKTTPILAILRKNLVDTKKTQILYTGALPASFDAEVVQRVYGYNFELKQVENLSAISEFDGSTVFISQHTEMATTDLHPNIDFYINLYDPLGSILLVNGVQNESYISDIQHVRRRETIAMTPADSLIALKALVAKSSLRRIIAL